MPGNFQHVLSQAQFDFEIISGQFVSKFLELFFGIWRCHGYFQSHDYQMAAIVQCDIGSTSTTNSPETGFPQVPH